MKKFKSILLVLLLCACHYNDVPVAPRVGDALIGKWGMIEQSVGGGGSGDWQLASPDQFVRFRGNFEFESNDYGNAFNIYNRYEVLDEGHIRLSGAQGTGPLEAGYLILEDQLELTPVCFEGCAYHFTRITY